MANNCYYEMRVKGTEANVDTFVKLLKAEYNEFPKHFWRVFSAEVYDESTIDGVKTVDICGDCAWSVRACMGEGTWTYMESHPDKSTSLREQSKLLQLQIEVYSSEPGMCFQEHYLYKNGEEIHNECVDYSEMYFEDEADFNKQKEEGDCDGYTWDDVDENGNIKVGGFGDWSFCI